MKRTKSIRNAAVWMFALCAGVAAAPASAQVSPAPGTASPALTEPEVHGRKLLDQMIEALGGKAWRERRNWKSTGNFGVFYKGKPEDIALKFEEYHRAEPFATRFVIVTHAGSNIGALIGIPIGKDHKDIVQLLTPDHAYEVTFRGKKELPKDIETEQLRQRAHTLDVVVGWLQQPGTGVLYEGSVIVARRLADKVSVTDSDNETVTLELDANTHLPLSRSFRYRDPVFNDFNDDREEYDNYQTRDGVTVPFTVTRYKNDDMVAQRFIADIHFNVSLEPALFDPDVPLTGKEPKH